MYKIALNAGHYIGTPGKRIPKALDPGETREWTLNNRICDKIEVLLTGYTGYELLRIDDTTGKTDVSLKDRTDAANAWGADEYYAVHHNALDGTPWKGGGIVVFVHPDASAASKEMQKQLYDSLVRTTGLKGNRSEPLAKANFHELRETKMPAVLMELGFMDSEVDAPIILTEAYADRCAAAIVEVMVDRGGLKKKENKTGTQYAESGPDESRKGTYKVKTKEGSLHLRSGASTDQPILELLPNGSEVRCYGYYTGSWLYVVAPSGTTGFVSEKYVEKI